MKLYEINQLIEEIIDNSLDTEGELHLTDASALELNKLNLAKEEKIENYGIYIKNCTAEYLALKEEKKNIDNRMKTLDKKIIWLKNVLLDTLEGEKYKTPKVSISYRKSEAVSVEVDISELPEKYQKISVSADKTTLKKDLKAGLEVSGCKLVTNNNIQVK